MNTSGVAGERESGGTRLGRRQHIWFIYSAI